MGVDTCKYKCELCGTVHNSIADYAKCVAKCSARIEEENRIAQEKVKAEQKDKRYKEVKDAYNRYKELRDKYLDDYNYIELKDGDSTLDFSPFFRFL